MLISDLPEDLLSVRSESVPKSENVSSQFWEDVLDEIDFVGVVTDVDGVAERKLRLAVQAAVVIVLKGPIKKPEKGNADNPALLPSYSSVDVCVLFKRKKVVFFSISTSSISEVRKVEGHQFW